MTERTCNLQCVTYDDLIERQDREIQVLMWYNRCVEIAHDEGCTADHIDQLLDEYVQGGSA